MNQVITPKVQPCGPCQLVGRELFGFPLFSRWILIDACALGGVWKGEAFTFIAEEIWGKSVLEAEPFEWGENTKFKNALCRSSSCEWDDRAAFLLFITGILRLHLLISVCWLFALWFLRVLIRESRPGGFCFWVVLRKSKKNSLAPSLLFRIIVCYCFWMGLGFQMPGRTC